MLKKKKKKSFVPGVSLESWKLCAVVFEMTQCLGLRACLVWSLSMRDIHLDPHSHQGSDPDETAWV